MAAPTQADFVNGPLADHGQTVSRTPVTVNEHNITGHKVYTDGTPVNISAVVENPNTKRTFDRAGLTITPVMRMFVAGDVTINKDDKVTINSIDYRVDAVSTRFFDGNAILKTVNLFRIEK